MDTHTSYFHLGTDWIVDVRNGKTYTRQVHPKRSVVQFQKPKVYFKKKKRGAK